MWIHHIGLVESCVFFTMAHACVSVEAKNIESWRYPNLKRPVLTNIFTKKILLKIEKEASRSYVSSIKQYLWFVILRLGLDATLPFLICTFVNVLQRQCQKIYFIATHYSLWVPLLLYGILLFLSGGICWAKWCLICVTRQELVERKVTTVSGLQVQVICLKLAFRNGSFKEELATVH